MRQLKEPQGRPTTEMLSIDSLEFGTRIFGRLRYAETMTQAKTLRSGTAAFGAKPSAACLVEQERRQQSMDLGGNLTRPDFFGEDSRFGALFLQCVKTTAFLWRRNRGLSVWGKEI
jgi:hypothetical protein